jgi:4-aminobutyrate aminotransferase/(S)-3-amino-2-methylpropionate transaminase
VQTGFGRTGALFASEHYGIEPDIFVTAKSLGGGLPLAAITGRAEIMDAPQPGGLGGTFGGNPLSCAAALAVLDAFENENESLSARANELGNRFQGRALDWQRRWPVIGDVRGLGAMQAMELVQSADIVQDCYEHGLIILSAGSYSNVIRALMPLVITDAQMDEALVVLESALQTVCERKEAAAQPV